MILGSWPWLSVNGKSSGAQVVSIQEPWADVFGEMQELLTAIMAWLARLESQRRSAESLPFAPVRSLALALPCQNVH